MRSLSPRARLSLLLCVVLLLCLTGLMAWWVLRPQYAVLFNNVREADAAEITAGLRELKVPFEIAGSGDTILVPKDQVHQARLDLMSQGVPLRGVVGFEIFNEADYGMTEFSQKVNYQRALQGELARSIMTLDEVKFARVHLSLRRAGLFQADEEGPKASVTLMMEDGAALDARKVAGIQQLVAAAVESLKPEQVTILDQSGVALAGSENQTSQSAASFRLQEKQQLEDRLREKIRGLLENSFGLHDVALSVDVTLNYDKVKTVREEVLGGNGQAGEDAEPGLLLRKRESRDNQPQTVKDGESTTPPARQSTTTEQEFAVGKQLEETVVAPGGIARISIGVMLPDALTKDKKELERLQKVIAAAIGLDAERGDRIEIGEFTPKAITAAAHAQVPAMALPKPQKLSEASGRSGKAWPDYFGYLVAMAVLILLGLLALVSRRRAPAQPRLTQAQRAELLQEVRDWLEQPVAQLERTR